MGKVSSIVDLILNFLLVQVMRPGSQFALGSPVKSIKIDWFTIDVYSKLLLSSPSKLLRMRVSPFKGAKVSYQRFKLVGIC